MSSLPVTDSTINGITGIVALSTVHTFSLATASKAATTVIARPLTADITRAWALPFSRFTINRSPGAAGTPSRSRVITLRSALTDEMRPPVFLPVNMGSLMSTRDPTVGNAPSRPMLNVTVCVRFCSVNSAARPMRYAWPSLVQPTAAISITLIPYCAIAASLRTMT